MVFSEEIKREVKEKAAFRCCRCNKMGIQVHHIVPQKDGGLDTIENAAPLCANCHVEIGNDPNQRKQIKEMRDWWYKIVEKMLPKSSISFQELNRININIEQMNDNYQKGIVQWQSDINDLKNIIKVYSENIIKNLNPNNVSTAVSGIVNTFDSLATGVQLGPQIPAPIKCLKCGMYIGIASGNKCPNCGGPITK